MFGILLLILLHRASSAVYYVMPDDHYPTAMNGTHIYLNDSSKYLSSGNKLCFLPGEYHLWRDFILEDVSNYTVEGDNTTIYCNKLSGIEFVNVSNLMISNIALIQCGKRHNTLFSNGYNEIPLYWYGAVCLHQCSSVTINSISIFVSAGVNGIIAINSKGIYNFTNINVIVHCELNASSSNGVVFYYYDYNHIKTTKKVKRINVTNYNFKPSGLCFGWVALNIIAIQKTYNVSIKVQKSIFSGLNNSSVLRFHGESCGDKVDKIVTFSDCKSNHNIGNRSLNLFHIMIYRQGYALHVQEKNHCRSQTNIVNFRRCEFLNNSNIHSIIYLVLKNSLPLNAYIDIRNSKFYYNYWVMLIRTKNEVQVLWQLSHYILIMDTKTCHQMYTAIMQA